MKQVYRGLNFNYTAIGFEAECSLAIIESIRKDGKKESIQNRRFKLNVDSSIEEIMSQDVGNENDFVISGDNAKEYNPSFGTNDGTFKSLECLSWTRGTNDISVDFNTFRDKLLRFYRFLIENGTVENDTGRCVFKISDRESIVISYLPRFITHLGYTVFQSTVSCDTTYVLDHFRSIYKTITDEVLPDNYFKIKHDRDGDLLMYRGLFNYLVHTFLEIYKNKKGKLHDKKVDRKAFVPLALRNTLTDIIVSESTRNKFAKLLKKTILKNIPDHEKDQYWDEWITILDTYIYNLPTSLDISRVNMRDKITFEIRCFERIFLDETANENLDADFGRSRSSRVDSSSEDDDKVIVKRNNKNTHRRIIDDDDEKGGGFVKKTRKRRRTYKKQSYKKNKIKNRSK
jgi:hypothetical protein